MTIMEHTADKINTQIVLLPLLLKVFAISEMRLWYDSENIEDNVVNNIGIRCRNSRKTTGLSVKTHTFTNTLSLNVC